MRRLIVDTDIGPDCDDVGALAVLFELEKSGEAVIECITNCTSNVWGSYCISYMCCWYGSKATLGELKTHGFLDDESCKKYNEDLGRRYIKAHGERMYADAVRVMRHTLQEAADQSITLLGIGPLKNIALLLQSESDDISLMSGKELLLRKVKDVVLMAGVFSKEAAEGDIPEYNIACDIPSARYVMEHMPVPVTYCGFEVGDKVMTGFSRNSLEKEHPVRIAYDLYTGENGVRQSFDPITALYAVWPEYSGLKRSGGVDIYTDEAGFVRFNKKGDDCYIILNESVESLAQTVEDIMCGRGI